MKKIFITGGAGYVGSVLVPLLLKENFFVTVLDLMIYGEDVLEEHPNLKKVQGDIRDEDLLNKIIPGHDVVMHLACISNDPSFELNPDLGKSINLDAFRPLVEISSKANISRSPKIYTQGAYICKINLTFYFWDKYLLINI